MGRERERERVCTGAEKLRGESGVLVVFGVWTMFSGESRESR